MGHECSGGMYVEAGVLVMVYGCREGKLRVVVDRVSCHRRFAYDVATKYVIKRYIESIVQPVIGLLSCWSTCRLPLSIHAVAISLEISFTERTNHLKA